MAATNQNARWWDEPKDDVHDCLVSVFSTVRSESMWRIDAHEYHAGLYCSSDRPGVRGVSRRGYEYGPATLPYNVSRAAVDTLTSKIGKHRPLPMVLTSRGSWTNQRRARKMTQFLEGEFYRQKFFEKHWTTMVRDSLIFGDGILKVWVEDDPIAKTGNICTERVHIWELFCDPWDARYGSPRNLYHCRSVDKGVLLAQFARTDSGGWRSAIRDAIDSAGRFDLADARRDTEGSTVDRVDIVEAWHLPSYKGAKDGRHVVIVEGATLLDERYELDYFPFVNLGYNAPIEGFWSHGLVEQIEGYQFSINEAAEKLAEQYRMSGVGVLVPDNGQIHDQQIRNGITILRHKAGGQPSVFQMDLVNEHLRARPRELTQDALNDAGLSQMSVQSEKPAGVTAAIAIQTLDDIETERFMVFGRACEAVCMEIGRRYVDCAKYIAEKYGDHAVSVPMRGGLIDLKWSEVNVDGAELKVQPTAMMAQQLPERLQTLTDLFNTGQIDGATFLREMMNPDLRAEIDTVTADRIVVDETIERMLDASPEEGQDAYMPPSEYQQVYETLPDGSLGPGWAPKRATQRYNRALLDGADEYNLDLLQQYIKHCQDILDRAQAKKTAMMAPPPPAPGATPGGPPPPAQPMAPQLPDIGIPGQPPMAA